MLFALATYSIPSSHKTFLLFDIQGLQNTCISCTWIFVRKKCSLKELHWINYLLYQIIKVYLSLLKYSFCTKYIYLDHSVGINSSKENLWIIYHLPGIYISWSRWIPCVSCNSWQNYKTICSHTSFVIHKYTRFCAVVNALQPFAHHS